MAKVLAAFVSCSLGFLKTIKICSEVFLNTTLQKKKKIECIVPFSSNNQIKTNPSLGDFPPRLLSSPSPPLSFLSLFLHPIRHRIRVSIPLNGVHMEEKKIHMCNKNRNKHGGETNFEKFCERDVDTFLGSHTGLEEES